MVGVVLLSVSPSRVTVALCTQTHFSSYHFRLVSMGKHDLGFSIWT